MPCVRQHGITSMALRSVHGCPAARARSAFSPFFRKVVGITAWPSPSAMLCALTSEGRSGVPTRSGARDCMCRALRRINELESGQVRYKTNDIGYRSDRVSNCIHGVSTVVDRPRLRVVSPGWGEVASYSVLLRFEPWVIDPDRVHDWIALAMGLNAYPIHYRAWEPPLSGTIVGPVNRFFGGERGVEPTYGPPPCRSARGRR